MEPFDVKAFQQRVQQARTPNDFQQLKQELSQRLKGLSDGEKTPLRQDLKAVWFNLNNRIDMLITETEELNRQVTA